jgi:NAD(P)-dependent dehydrogenase (short-subunit alcohol dehydrogenase family)
MILNHAARRTCVVTGGTSGIGREIVKGLCALGHHVVFLARDGARSELLVRDIATSRAGSGMVVYNIQIDS